LDMSYATVILARNIYAHRIEFRPGPYTLGRWQKPINAITCAWVFFISVVLLFPTVRPVTAANMNYAVAVAGFIGVFSLSWWWAGARKYVLSPSSVAILISAEHILDPEHRIFFRLSLLWMAQINARMTTWMSRIACIEPELGHLIYDNRY
jgi:hypothetical protein